LENVPGLWLADRLQDDFFRRHATKEGSMRGRSIVLSAAILLGSVGFVDAQQPTLSDIALCNEQATGQAGGSALPGPRPLREPRTGAASDARTREKTDPSGSIITESPDPLVTGMDAGKADDPAYRAVYRDCMRQRMGKDR
jgi:hypothetical protein